MAVSFSRTARALDADRNRGARLLLVLGLALFFGWAAWFFFGRVTVYEVSRRARIEVSSASRALAVDQGGRLVASGLYIGRKVRAGEVLADLDAEPQKLRLAEAEARLAGYPARIAALQDALASTRSARSGARSSATAAVAMADVASTDRRIDAAAISDLQQRATSQLDLLAELHRDAVDAAFAPEEHLVGRRV